MGKEKLTAGWNKIRDFLIRGDNFCVLDWVLFGVMAAFCFASYMHGDLLMTGNRSWLLYDGISSFYDNAAEWTGGYGANYMPSTFFLFALWNLPLKLFGVKAPVSLKDSRLILCVWYKILPLLFFIGSCVIFYQIARQIGLGKHKAKICMYAFMTMPALFYSQFIFSQCDIFTLFFMLAGMYFFYRNEKHDMIWFTLCFALAMTFKYYSVIIYCVMVLVREKRVLRIIAHGIGVLIPFGIEYLMYRGYESFQISVTEFSALDYVSSSDFSTTILSVSLVKAGCIFMALWAYIVHPKDKNNETAWTLYLSCGVCFLLFCTCYWHPQWLMLMAPCMVLSAFISPHTDKFLWMEAGLSVVTHYVITMQYPKNVDVTLLRYLSWRNVFDFDHLTYTLSNYIPFLDKNTASSIFFALMLALFVFKHPKYALQDFAVEDGTDHMYVIRLRLLITVLIFTVPAFMACYMNTFA